MSRARLQVLFGVLVLVWMVGAGIFVMDARRLRSITRPNLETTFLPPTVGGLAAITDFRPSTRPQPPSAASGAGGDAEQAGGASGSAAPAAGDLPWDDTPAPAGDLPWDNSPPAAGDLPWDQDTPGDAATASGDLPWEDTGLQTRADEDAPPPGEPGYWLGTDSQGRRLAWLIAGAPGFYLWHGLLYLVLATSTMVLLGVLSGYVRKGAPGSISRWVVEANHSLPQLLIIFVVLAIFGTRMLCLVITLALISGVAKSILVRNKIESVRAMDFIEGLKEMGLSGRVIVWRHLLRTHCRALILVQMPFLLAELILFEACMGYLEHSVDTRHTLSFGAMLANAVHNVAPEPGVYWPFAFPALGIVVLIWGLNALGVGLAGILNERNPHSL